MKKSILICITLFGAVSGADIISGRAGSSLRDPKLKNLCRSMGKDYLNEIDQINRLFIELKFLTSQVDSAGKSENIKNIVSRIREYSVHIQYLLKPEWNIETIPIDITWTVPKSIFFDDSEYLNNKKKTNEMIAAFRKHEKGPFALQNIEVGPIYKYRNASDVESDNLRMALIFRHNLVERKKIQKAIFMNSESRDIANYLILNPKGIWRTDEEEDLSFVIIYRKNATLLEACQLLNSLIFEIEVDFAMAIPGQELEDASVLHEKKVINLIFNNEVENDSIP